MSTARLNTMRLNTVSLNAMPINRLGIKKGVSSSASGDVDENGYIIFADPEVERVLLANGVGDGVGITKEAAAATTSLSTWFVGNTTITTFNELGMFGGEEGVKVSFRDCTNLNSVDFSNVVDGTENGAFSGLSSLRIELDLPKLKIFPYVGCKKSAFIGVKNLGLITSIPAAFMYNENGAFYQCTELKYANIPEAITTLPRAVFSECSALENIDIDWEKITSIEDAALGGCSSLYLGELSLPNLVALGGYAFTAVKIKKIDIRNVNVLPTIWDYFHQSYGKSDVLEEVVLSSQLTDIPSYSFSGYSALSSCSLPQSVTSIGEQAFHSCSSLLIDLNLPNLESLGSAAFSSSGIKSITSLGKITTIAGSVTWSYGTFANCASLETVILPETLESIELSAFNHCPSLRWIKIYAPTPPALGDYAFLSTNNCPIYVPDESVEAYKAATNWATYADRILPLSEYVEQ